MNQHRMSTESEVSSAANREVESYGPSAWMLEWPHEQISVWDAWSKVYERFGVAAERSNDLETGLIMLVAQKEQEDPEIESLLSALSKRSEFSLGRLISLFCKLYGVSKRDPLCQELEQARKSRNYLIHHFYRDRAELFKSPEGCTRLVEILVSIHDGLDAAVERLEEWRDRRVGYRVREANRDQVIEDAEEWRREEKQMLDAILGRQQRLA